MIRVGVVVGLAATVGVTSFYNITQGAFQLSVRLGPVMVFFGVYFGTFRTYLVYPALILIVAGVAAYIFGRLLYRANTNQA